MLEKKSDTFDAVILDWGGVISTGGTPDEAGASISRALDISVTEAAEFVRKYSGRLKRGQIDEVQFMSEICADLGIAMQDSFHTVWPGAEHFRPDESVLHFINELSATDHLVGVLSNTFPATAHAIRAQGWYDHFDAVATSSDDGFAKPDPEFYQLILNRLNVRPDRSIFVDDQEYCLAAARELGIITVKAVAPEQYIPEVRSLLSLK